MFGEVKNLNMSRILIHITAITFFLFGGWFSFVCYQENEKTTLKKSIALAITTPITFIIPGFTNDYFIATTLYILTGLFTLSGIMLLFPTKIHSTDKEHSAYRLYERNTMFYRLKISESQEKSNAYYFRNPEKETIDLEKLEKPELWSENPLTHDHKAFATANASFKLIEKLRSYVDPISSNEKETIHARNN